MVVLKRIGVLSCGKLMGTLYAVMGLIFGAIMSLASAFGAAVAHGNQGADAIPNVVFGIGSVVIFPILYGIIGFVGGLITSSIYNLVAGIMGGLELEMVQHVPQA
jgi:hypothetical protein